MEQAANRADLAAAAFDDAREGMEDAIRAIRSRFETTRAYYSRRIEALNAVVADVSESPVIRRAAQAEIDSLNNSRLSPTPDETAIFNEHHTAALNAIDEMRKCESDFLEAYKNVMEEMKDRRAEIISRDPSLRMKWIASNEKEFRELSQ